MRLNYLREKGHMGTYNEKKEERKQTMREVILDMKIEEMRINEMKRTSGGKMRTKEKKKNEAKEKIQE